jgi:hypothetical protein
VRVFAFSAANSVWSTSRHYTDFFHSHNPLVGRLKMCCGTSRSG